MEKEIVEYKVIVSDGFTTTLSFETEVANAISEGWQPFGGIVVLPGGFITQTMVKYKKQ